jgi:hypothetical protein
MSTTFRRNVLGYVRAGVPGRRTALRALGVLAALGLASCTDSRGRPNFLGIPLSSPASRAADLELAERQRRQMEVFGGTILNPSEDIDPDIRRQAAEELIAMDLPAATEVLASGLRSGQASVVQAVIDALESGSEPVPGLLPAASETLCTVSGRQLEKLALILPRYGEPALKQVAALARDRGEAPERRFGPIYALSSFRSREAAVQLMLLLDEGQPESPAIVAAAGASLERLTGLPYGDDAAQWRRWWDRLKNEPIENWLRIMVLHLSNRTSELEREVHEKTRETEQTARRLAEALRELFLTLNADQRNERLPALLSDELSPVRQFALGRVERRLRDSERVPEIMHVRLAERLNDRNELPSSRLLAARLLSELNDPNTPKMVAAAMTDETDPKYAAGYLEILARQPTPEAFEQILLWLDDPAAGQAASAALWGLVSNRMVPKDQLATTRRAVRLALDREMRPTLVCTLAAIGDGDDRRRAVSLLDSGEPALRREAAQGLAFAGDLAPLLARARDENVYPHALRLVAQGPPRLDTLRTLTELVPPEALRPEWARTVKAAADVLPPTDLQAADDLLKAAPPISRTFRAEVLARVTTLPPNTLGQDQRIELLVRLAQLRIELGEFQAAYDILVWPNGTAAPAAIAGVKFKASVLAGHYDEAAALNAEPSAWVSILEEHAALRPQAATALGVEIRRRFAERLTGEVAARLKSAEQRLNELTSAPTG